MGKRFLAAAVVLILTALDAAAQTSVWQVTTAPPPLVLLRDRAAPLTVVVAADSVTSPQIIGSTLRDSSTGALLTTQYLSLCERVNGACTAPAKLAKGPHGLFITVADTFSAAGEFKGTLHLKVDEKPEPLAVEFTVDASTYGAWIGGLIAIIAGVLLSLWATVFAKQRSLRLDALAPAALLADHLKDAKVSVDKATTATGFAFPATNAQLSTLLADLSEDTLDAQNFLPRTFGRPLSGDVASEGYKAYLTQKGDLVAAITALVTQGLPPILAEWDQQSQQAALTQALKDLDALAKTVLKPADVPAAVAGVIASMNKALHPPPPGAAAQMRPAGGPPAPPGIRSSVEIRSQQSHLALLAWGIWAIVTVAVGLATLIVSSNAFGVPLDYFKCFFWGLGVQSAGQQLQQLTPSSVASSIKLSLPK